MPRTHRNRKSPNTNDEQKNIDASSLHEDMPYFSVPKDVILDVGDEWAATHIGYPQYHYGEKCYVVECIINDKYFRLMPFEWILREPEICEHFAKYVKKYVHHFSPATVTALKSIIESQMTYATSPFNKSDILWYADAPEIVEKSKARIVLVTRTKKIKTFKCKIDLALTTEIKHLDSSLDNPKLDTHPICIKPGTLPAIVLELLIPAREGRKIGERATKYKMIAMSNALESKEWEERYNNRVKVSVQNVKGTLKHFDKILQKTLKEKKVGIVTTPKIPAAKSLFKYEVKRYLMKDMELNQWKRGKDIEYHRLSLSELASITSAKATRKEIVKMDANGDSDKHILTWEGARIAYDHKNKELFMKLNLVRVDPKNGMVIGSYKQKTHERYLQRKQKAIDERDRKRKAELEKKQNSTESDGDVNMDNNE